MISFKQFLNEVHHTSFLHKWARKEHMVDVYKNPSRSELRKTSDANYAGGNGKINSVILHKDDMYTFKRSDSLHFNVAEHSLKNPMDRKDSISLDVMHDKQGADIHVTDNTRGRWKHNPDIKKQIENHPMIKKHFPKIDNISYYDEAINGPWHEMNKGNE